MKEIIIPKIEVSSNRYFIADKEIYKETQAKSKEKFGENSQAYKTIINGIDSNNGTGSQFFFNNETNLYLPKNQKVISLKDIERIYSYTNEFFGGSFYTDTLEIILKTETPAYYKNEYILKDLVKQLKGKRVHGAVYEFSSNNPLRILDLESIKDENPKNEYGLLLKITKDTKIINDKRFASSNNKIQLGNQTKILYTKQDGLSGVYLNSEGNLDFVCGYLASSCDYGRVVLKDIKESAEISKRI